VKRAAEVLALTAAVICAVLLPFAVAYSLMTVGEATSGTTGRLIGGFSGVVWMILYAVAWVDWLGREGGQRE
jgi:hypothetical protein